MGFVKQNIKLQEGKRIKIYETLDVANEVNLLESSKDCIIRFRQIKPTRNVGLYRSPLMFTRRGRLLIVGRLH